MPIIDSSSIVKYFSREPGWEGVRQHLGESITLNMAIVELANALRKKVTKNKMTPEEATNSLHEYSDIAYVIDQNIYIKHALQISLTKGTSVYDSMFIAAALAIEYDLVSSDDKQLKIAKELGVRTIKC